jgi:hypothetical protein
MLVALQLEGVAAIPLNITVLAPCAAPKLVPLIVTELPGGPEGGDRLLILGDAITVKDAPLLSTPLTWTTTLPLVAPDGTGTTTLVALQLVGVAALPLKATVLLPWVEPKLLPVIVTDVPTVPDVGERLLMLGDGTTVKETALLMAPFTLTTTFPVVAPLGTGATIEVALQLVGLALVPLNVTVLVPWVVPKFVPVIVTDAPMAPELGDRLVMLGETTNVTPLLFTPLA